MKKLLISLVVVAFASFALTSCKKDYTCECEYEMLGVKQTHSFPIEKSSKKDAKDVCSEYATTAGVGGITYNCALKY